MRLCCLTVVLAACSGSVGLVADSERFDGVAWHQGPLLEAPRGGHSATLLPDGRIAVLGGASTTSVSAQICDASECTVHGSLVGYFERHDAVLLSSGKILIAGGTFASPPELYDPADGSAREAPSDHVTEGSRLVALTDGRVLAIGPGTSATFFDPATEVWTDAPALSSNAPHVAVALAGGHVLAVDTCYLCASTSAEVFDPAVNAWSAAPPPLATHETATLTLLQDGRVLLVGGGTLDAGVGAELYDPAASRWSIVGDLAQNRVDHAATLMTDGRVLVTGGRIHAANGEHDHPTYAIFDPVTTSWSTGDGLSWRQYHPAIRDREGSILVIGGDRGYIDARSE